MWANIGYRYIEVIIIKGRFVYDLYSFGIIGVGHVINIVNIYRQSINRSTVIFYNYGRDITVTIHSCRYQSTKWPLIYIYIENVSFFINKKDDNRIMTMWDKQHKKQVNGKWNVIHKHTVTFPGTAHVRRKVNQRFQLVFGVIFTWFKPKFQSSLETILLAVASLVVEDLAKGKDWPGTM